VFIDRSDLLSFERVKSEYPGLECFPPLRPPEMSFSFEVLNLKAHENLTEEAEDLVPKHWSENNVEDPRAMISFRASSYMKISRPMKNMNEGHIERVNAMDEFLKESTVFGRHIYLVTSKGKNFVWDRMNRLASTPVPTPSSYWPWIHGPIIFDS
jgi:hypothetical protein